MSKFRDRVEKFLWPDKKQKPSDTDRTYYTNEDLKANPPVNGDEQYEQVNGPKLRLVQPSESIKDFNYLGATGNIQTTLAKMGRF